MNKSVTIVGILALHVPLPRDTRELHTYHIPVKEIIRCLEGLTHKVLDILRIDPSSTDTNLYL